MDSEKLLACPNPWCASHAAPGGEPTADDIWAMGEFFRVQCVQCNMVGPHADSEKRAAAAWNDRPANRPMLLEFADASAISPEAFERAPKHHYWGAGDPNCPADIRAGNGELHTLRCKICELDNPRNPICHADAFFARAEASRPTPENGLREALERVAAKVETAKRIGTVFVSGVTPDDLDILLSALQHNTGERDDG